MNNVISSEGQSQLDLFGENSLKMSSNHQAWESAKVLIDHFLLNQNSKHTRDSYRRGLKSFFDFTNNNFGLPRIVNSFVRFDEITHHHVLSYRLSLNHHLETGHSYAPKSIIAMIAAVQSFYDYLIKQVPEYADLKYNPAEHIKRPKANNLKETKCLETSTVRSMLNDIENPIHKAIIVTLFTTGMRQGELRNIKRKDLDEDKGIHFVRITLKGGDLLKVALHPRTYYFIMEYLRFLEKSGRFINDNNWLFQSERPSGHGKQLGSKSVYNIVQKYFQGDISPHSARATYITSLLEQEEDLYSVSKSVGHKSVNTTKGYDKRDKDLAKSPALRVDFF